MNCPTYEIRQILDFSMDMNIDNKRLWWISVKIDKDKMSTKFEKDILLIYWVRTRKGKNET